MNWKKVLKISGIVLLVILVIYLVLNPAWFTHPKYMIDERYCEQDSDCRMSSNNCGTINIHSYSKQLFGGKCSWTSCGTICNTNNQCELKSCEDAE